MKKQTKIPVLKGGLPGHYSEKMAEDLFNSVGDDFIYLILDYQPDDYRQAPFNCTHLERKIINSAEAKEKGMVCDPRTIEFMLFTLLSIPAKETGEKMGNESTYEHLYIALFLARHYGDLLDRWHAKLSSNLRQWAREFVNTVEQFDRPDEELNIFEKVMKAFRLNNHNMARTRDNVKSVWIVVLIRLSLSSYRSLSEYMQQSKRNNNAVTPDTLLYFLGRLVQNN
ncbi:hypothetical protein PN36_18110 [Candidatus Thiomargarita nelsonii]|uniref:Uncharacterized protein n=1 Tax=Candidatus Thiomargarita nelsonii TaxID=1003181 RepID=A0A0A6P5T5_9GAMM|nr:hypothetical protein PN36_18110 [Candidatus Thiomargarita nelsonii]